MSKGKSLQDLNSFLEEISNKASNLTHKAEGAKLDNAIREFAVASEANTDKLVSIVEPKQVKITGLKTNLRNRKLLRVVATEILK